MEWKRKLAALKSFIGVCAGAKYLIIYQVEEDDFFTIKQRYIGYGGVTTKKMMQLFRDKTCIEKKHNTMWDTTSDINIY